jgi:hypothetical protein
MGGDYVGGGLCMKIFLLGNPNVLKIFSLRNVLE